MSERAKKIAIFLKSKKENNEKDDEMCRKDDLYLFKRKINQKEYLPFDTFMSQIINPYITSNA